MLLQGSLQKSRAEPFLHIPPPPAEEEPSQAAGRQRWPRGSDSLAATWAFTLSLHSLLLLPVSILRHGGLVFLLQYLVLAVLLAGPLLLLELFLGQYSALPTCRLPRHLCPLLAGVGVGLTLLAVLRAVLDLLLAGWAGRSAVLLLLQSGPGSVDTELAANTTVALVSPGAVQPLAVAGVAAVGLLVYCLAAAGPRSLGKASLLLLPLSYGLLITLCIRTCLDPAGPAAVLTLLSPHWASLHQATAWLEAAAHAIWSLQLGTGVISTLGAYNKFQKQLLRDATVVTAGHAVWVLLSTFLLLSLTGLADTAAMESVAAKQEQEAAMAVLSQRSVVGDDGLLLANLQLILAAFSELSQGWLWAALYCILLLLILLTNLAGYLELITNSVIGHRVSCIRFKPLVALLVMLVLVLLCLPLTTQSGLVVQQVLATFCADWPTLLFSILTVVAATCCHSMLSLVKDLCYMSRHQLSHFLSSHLSVVLTTIAPVLLAVSTALSINCECSLLFNNFVASNP